MTVPSVPNCRPKTLMLRIYPSGMDRPDDFAVVPIEVRGDLTNEEIVMLYNAVVLAFRKRKFAHGPEQKAWDRFMDLGAKLLAPRKPPW